MNVQPLEVYSESSNYAIVRLPGREFPGSVIQGDTLASLCGDARELSIRLRAVGPQDEELLWIAQRIQEQLLGRLLHYQKVLSEHGMRLPYGAPAAAEDQVVLVTPEPDSEA